MDGRKEDDGEGPLSSEALARDEWRGDDTPGGEGEAIDEESGTDGPNPMSGTMLPPD
jgi:hypothetical protein